MLSVVYYGACLSYQMLIKTRHNKLCVVTSWLFYRIDQHWPYCIHSDTKACFCLDSSSTLGARLTISRAHRVVKIFIHSFRSTLEFDSGEVGSTNQGCGVGVEESEGFSTWGVGVAENFNDSDSTFCSPIMTVCATNVRKRHTSQFKQLNVSTRDDPGYSDRRQRTNLHNYTQGPFQISSIPWAHHATYTEPMQPFGA